MITVLTKAANTNLVQIQTVKDQLGITDTSKDTLLEELIAEASAAVADYCNRTFWLETYNETVAGFNRNHMMLSKVPVWEILQATYNGAALPQGVAFSIEDAEAGDVYSPVPWYWTAEIGIDIGQKVIPDSEIPRFGFTYVGGWNLPGDADQTHPLPRTIEFATLDVVREWYYGRHREERLYQRKVGDLMLSYQPRTTDTGLTVRAELLLQRYVRILS